MLPEPRFRLATIHATKGREADVVVLVPDMTQATFAQHKSYRPSDREPENRVAYVAVTRARKQLIVVEAQTKRSYPYASFARSAINGRLAMSPAATTHALPR